MQQKQHSEQPGTSGSTQVLDISPETIETESTSATELFGSPALKFKRYLGATCVRYIQMGQAIHVQDDNSWDLEDTI